MPTQNRFSNNNNNNGEENIWYIPSPKKVEYSRDAENRETTSTANSRKPSDQVICNYISNHTRLPCSNVCRRDQLPANGLCKKHSSYIKKLRIQGKFTQKLMDPGYSNISMENARNDKRSILKNLNNIPYDFKGLFRSVNSSSEIFKNTKFFTKKEILREYLDSIETVKDEMTQLRSFYAEKYIQLFLNNPDKMMEMYSFRLTAKQENKILSKTTFPDSELIKRIEHDKVMEREKILQKYLPEFNRFTLRLAKVSENPRFYLPSKRNLLNDNQYMSLRRSRLGTLRRSCEMKRQKCTVCANCSK